ncbi:hypothetical protein MKX03_022997 [Papaver bracteatum]|nr:hypothetical protein MKX03_022997 [Papaver bracteatum]
MSLPPPKPILPRPPQIPHDPLSTPLSRSVLIAGAVLLGIVVILVIYRVMKRGSSVEKDLKASKGSEVTVTGPPYQLWQVGSETMEKFILNMASEKPIRFTTQELHSFTNNYATRLGSGGFGVVYQGQLPNGVKIAVKVLNRNEDKNVEEQFMAEVGTIGRTYHINLVRLYGFCFDHQTSALIYEYMENGSLDGFLFNKEALKFKWEKLLDIAIGTAKGLAYLHEDCHQRIIHYDIKPGNVLLDQYFLPKVADFGLAKLCNRESTHVSFTGYRGTPGYSAPEFLLHNYPITHKCDVYSFGMLLFEMVTRQRNFQTRPVSEIIDWFPKKAWEEYEKGQLTDLIFQIGIEEKDKEKAERMFMTAFWCVQDTPDSRPLMSTVVKMLEGGVEILPPSNPFRYLFALDPTDVVIDSYTTGSDSSWYKDSAPIMKKQEMQMTSSR